MVTDMARCMGLTDELEQCPNESTVDMGTVEAGGGFGNECAEVCEDHVPAYEALGFVVE